MQAGVYLSNKMRKKFIYFLIELLGIEKNIRADYTKELGYKLKSYSSWFNLPNEIIAKQILNECSDWLIGPHYIDIEKVRKKIFKR